MRKKGRLSKIFLLDYNSISSFDAAVGFDASLVSARVDFGVQFLNSFLHDVNVDFF